MATPQQQYIYVFCAHQTGYAYVKIGISADPNRRLRDLRTACPYELVEIARVPGTHADEKRLHKLLKGDHMHGEWFWFGAKAQSVIERFLGVDLNEDH